MEKAMHEPSRPAAVADEAYAPPGAGSIEEIDLTELLRKIRRRKGVIFGTVILLTALAGIIVFQLTPRYTAETLVMIGARESKIVDLEAVLAGLSTDAESVQSEIEVMRSRGLAEKVIKHLGLDREPEFNEALRPKGLLEDALDIERYLPEEWLAGEWMTAILGRAHEEALSEDDERARERVRVVDAFLENLEVSPKGRSRVIAVEFTSETAKTAAEAANTLADLYIVEQLEAKFAATQRATAWLNDRVASLREKVGESERAVEAFRKRSGLLEGKGVSLTSQEVTELNTQLILAGSARAEAEARLQQTKMLVASPDGVESAAEVLDSQLIQRLREQEAEVHRRAAELSTEYGERHPKMINVRAEIRDLKAKIRSEVAKIVKGLENEAAVARARQLSLQTSHDKLFSPQRVR